MLAYWTLNVANDEQSFYGDYSAAIILKNAPGDRVQLKLLAFSLDLKN